MSITLYSSSIDYLCVHVQVTDSVETVDANLAKYPMDIEPLLVLY